MAKEKMKARLSVGTLVTLFGIALCYWDFYTNNHIQGSSLGFLGECLMWSGSLYGCKSYIDYKTNKNQ